MGNEETQIYSHHKFRVTSRYHRLSQKRVVSAFFPLVFIRVSFENLLVVVVFVVVTTHLPYFLMSVSDEWGWSWSISVDGWLCVFGGWKDVFGWRWSVFDYWSDWNWSGVCFGGGRVGAWLLVDDGIEAIVWVSGVIDGALGAVWFDQAVAALDDVALATLVLALGVTGHMVLDVVGVAVRRVWVVFGVVGGLGCRVGDRRVFDGVSVGGDGGDFGGWGEIGGRRWRDVG